MTRKTVKKKPQCKGKKRVPTKKIRTKKIRRARRSDGYYVLDKIITPID